MSEKIVLRVSDELAEKLEEECTERREQAVESLESHGWDQQAEQVKKADIAETTAEQAMFVLQSVVGE